MAKKKKSLSNSPAQPSTPSTTAEPGTPTTPSAASADTEAIDGSLTLQPVAALTPSLALSACLHWSSMRALGLTLGDAVHLRAVDAPSEQPCLLMRAWASARVAPRKVALPDEAHAALGASPRGVRLWAAANPTGGGGLREATAAVLHQEPSDGVAAGGVEWIRALLHGAAVCEGCVVPLKLYGQPLLLRVGHLSPPATAEQLAAPDGGAPQRPPLYQVTERTRLSLDRAEAGEKGGRRPPPTRLCDVAGMEATVEKIRQFLELPLRSPALFEQIGLPPPTGLLLHGPPGTGKTMIARAIAASLDVHVEVISASDLLSSYAADAEARLSASFDDVRAAAPAILFIDEIDALGSMRGSADSDSGNIRLLSVLLTQMDGVHERREPVVVLAATNRPHALDGALRRPGRFDAEVEVGVPSEEGRREILRSLFARTAHELSASQLELLASFTSGFVGADLAALHRHAVLSAIDRQEEILPLEAAHADLPPVSWADVSDALTVVRPSALREVELQVPRTTWDDIGGQAELKQALKEAVEWPLLHADAFARMGVRPPRGVLLYGPPGCSKTLAAKALASEARTNFIAVKGPELFSKWVGESERAVASLFRKARAAAPAIIFFDEIDALAASRDGGGSGGVGARVLSQLLHEVDGIQPLQSVLVVAATNRPDLVDPALLRPGRFDRLVHVTLPDEPARAQVLRIHTRQMPIAPDVDLQQLAAHTDGYSGAELAAVCREAALRALEEDITSEQVNLAHFKRALGVVKPRTTAATLSFFANYEKGTMKG